MTEIWAKILKAYQFVMTDVWRVHPGDLSFKKTFLLKQLRIIILTIRDFHKDNCILRASALTFYSLLSVVPVVAMAFGIAKGFGFEKMLEKELLEKFPGQEDIISQVIMFANSYLETTRGGMIAGVGMALLFWAVIKVLGHIEASFNAIWLVEKSRSFGRRFSDYLSIMLLGPVLLLLSSSANVFITSQITMITEKIALLDMFSSIIFSLMKFTPLLLYWVMFTIVYLLMPNTRVKLQAGGIAGFFAAAAFYVVQWGYIAFQIGAARYNAIYGSFAALPLFLIWLQLSWIIVLFGAELSFACQNVHMHGFKEEVKRISPAFAKLLALRICALIVQRFSRAESPLDAQGIAETLDMPIGPAYHILNRLVESDVLSRVDIPGNKAPAFQPARDAALLTVHAVIDALENNGEDHLPMAQSDELKTLSESLASFNTSLENSSANKLLSDI
ncbi:MAG: YihY/virulence factor BrkB family protein [Desulfobacterales bacterium]|nr:YihY/virulence factor BrkB family protein [Desulfobacterales bacterium]